MPRQILGERLVAPAAVAVTAPEHTGGLVRAAEVIDEGVVNELVLPRGVPPSGDLPACGGRVAGNVVRAGRDRNGCIELPLEGFELEFLLRAGQGGTQEGPEIGIEPSACRRSARVDVVQGDQGEPGSVALLRSSWNPAAE
jgi:hypothetical protein